MKNMSLRTLYRRRSMISFWCLVTITLVALYHKLNLSFDVLNLLPPPNEHQSVQISWNADELEKRFKFPIGTRLFQRHKVAAGLDNDDVDSNEKDFDVGGDFESNGWKLKRIHYYLNNTKETSIFPAFNIGRYILLNPNLCRDVEIIDIVILVHTAPINFERRQRIRQTFAKRSLFLPFEVRVAFLMGKPRNAMDQYVLDTEHTRHNDTVMGDFYDDYHNLTIKGVMGYRWISQFCSNSRFVLKIDDDVIVDMYKVLTRYIPHMEGKRKSIFCNVWRKNMKIERKGKWKVPFSIFSNTSVFPFYYCSGFTLLMSRDLINPLYNAAKTTPLFWIDDLYLFGILPFVIGGVTYHDYQIGRNISIEQQKAFDCWEKQGSQCSLFSTLVRNEDFGKFWLKIQQLNDHSSWRALTFFEP